ncbi:response regulator transcription factor [Desulfopila sp. IMCC35008]|uniref:response regulator n=1 Tax=Desulfopila sp. IMCC35008 TaxID=2653858 RepID=UPI0013D60D92|nr:response regulator transcription factor [Desulfopila sp. IMCC35008]
MKVLVIEDDIKIAGFISRALEAENFTVDTAHDGPAGLELGCRGVYDAAIVDIMLPEMDGLEVIERLRQIGVQTPVLILSAKQSVDDRIQGLQRGGDDYLVKPFSMSELLARIQALIRRDRKSIQPTVLKKYDLEMDLLKHIVTRSGKKLDLPAKEYALLELMMRNPGTVLSKTTILEKVYEYNFDPQTNVVDVLVFRLRNKVDKDFDTKLIHTVRGMGYVLKDSG